MRLVHKQSEPERLFDKVNDSLAATLHRADRGTLVKGALIAGGAVALTAGSAAISSLRRRIEANS